MDYEPIRKQLSYWINYDGRGDEYRKNNDRDCILTGGNLYADTIFSLWLPLRYTLNYYNCNKWIEWKQYEEKSLRPHSIKLKNYNDCLKDISDNITIFLPETELTNMLSVLFGLGIERANVMILPYRKWNNLRGGTPYFEYMPHFLYDLLNTNTEYFLDAIKQWISDEHLEKFFENNIVSIDNIRDLAGTGKVTSHRPNNIKLELLIRNYIDILNKRSGYY